MTTRPLSTLPEQPLGTFRHRGEAGVTPKACGSDPEWLRGMINALPDGVLAISEAGEILMANTSARQMLGYRESELVGMEVGAVLAIRNDPRESQETESDTVQESPETRTGVRRKDGQFLWIQCQTTEAEICGKPLLILTLREAARHSKSLDVLRPRERPQAVVTRLSLRALASTDLSAFLNDTVNAVAETLNVPFVGILQLQPDGRGLLVEAGTGWRAGTVGTAVVPAGPETHAGFAISSREPVVISEVREDKRFGPATMLDAHGATSGIVAPILGNPNTYGVLTAHCSSRREFGDEEVHFVKSVAHVVYTAIQRNVADSTIRRSEARLRALVDGTAQMVWAATRDGSLLEDSPSWSAFTGQSFVEARGWGWLDALHPGDKARVAEFWRKAACRNSPASAEYRVRHASGDWRWTAVRVVPLTLADGTFRGWVGMSTDISERKMAEEALRESETSLRIALYAGRVVAFDWNPESDVVLRSHNADQIFRWPGATKDLGRHYFERIHPIDRPRLEKVLTNLGETGGSYQEKYRLVRPDGSILWVEDDAQGVFDSRGNLVRLRGVIKDITQRVEAEQSLAELQRARNDSLALLETLLAHAPIGIALVDQKYRYVHVNKELSAINGVPPEDCLGAHVWEVVPALWSQVGPLYQRVLESGEPITDHEVHGHTRVHPEEARFWRVSYYPVRNSSEVTGVGVIVVDITERKRAERELLESRQRLSGIVDSALDAIITIDEEQRILVFNAAAEKMFLCSAHEVIGEKITRFIPPRLLAKDHGRFCDLSADGELQAQEYFQSRDLTALRSNGEEFPIEASLSEIEISGERLFTAILRDITERKRIEEDLLLQLQLTRAITDQAADAIFVTDNEGRVTFANPEAERIFGYSAGELRREVLNDLIHHPRPESPLLDLAEGDVQLSGGTVRNREDVFFRKDGTAVMLVCSSAPIEVHGQRIGTVVVAHDITQRKHAEEALRRSEERFRQIADSMPQIVWTVEPHGVCDYVNRNFATYTGIPSDTAPGIETLHPDDRTLTIEYWRRAFQSGQTFETEHRLRRADGAYRWHLSRGIPVRDASGSIVKWYATTTDIHERKGLEEALRSQAQMVELSHDAIILWRDPGGIEFWNRGAAALYGYERKDAIGQNPHKLLQTRFEPSKSRMEREMRKKGVWEGEVRQRARDGRELIVSSRSQLMPEPGEGRLVLEIGRDITESKRLEQAILEISGREQQRIGQDLHDDLCQRLAGVELRAQALASDLATRSDRDAQTAEAITMRIREAIAHTRLLARGLSPVALETDGLASALEQLANSTGEIFRIRATFNCGCAVAQRNQAAATHIYRIAQEAISNAVRHGRATEVHLRLQPQDDRVCLTVSDNGRGLQHDQPKSSGMGLRIMQYRAGMIGATLELRTSEFGGVEVACNFPKDL